MLTQRLGFHNQKNENYIKELIDIIKRHPGSCDEVWLATEYGYPTLEKHRESAALLGNSARLLREAGIRVSLQLSNTIGHGDYMGVRDCGGLAFDNSPARCFADADGKRANLSFCWHGEYFRRYTSETVKIYCLEIQPCRVWIDDDFRYDNHHPASKGCMCDDCIGRFNERYHSRFTRDSLNRAVGHGDPVWRRNYAEFIREGLCDIAEMITRAVVSVSPDSSMGYQHGVGCFPADGDIRNVFQALRGASGKPAGTRPGAGTYNDHDPSDMLRKIDCIRYQNSLVEGDADEIRPEIENFPHVCFGKSPAGTCFETTVYLAGGADAMSYAMMMYDFEPLAWHEEFFVGFSKHRSYWEKLSSLNKDTYECGLVHYLPRDLWERQLSDSDHNYAWTEVPWYMGNNIQRCGIPVCFRKDSPDPVYMLTAETAAALSEADIHDLITKPVICGGDALVCLGERGYADRFSAQAHRCSTLKLYETYTNHPANDPESCRIWENGLMQQQGSYLTDRDGLTEVLGYYGTDGSDVTPSEPGSEYPYGISSAIVKTSAGAGWVVLGQYPWTPVISWSKRYQMLRSLDIISGSRMPVISEGRHQAVLFPRENAEMRTTSITVINTTVGTAERIKLRVRRPYGNRVTAYRPCRNSLSLVPVSDGNELTVTLPDIAPWNACTIELCR